MPKTRSGQEPRRQRRAGDEETGGGTSVGAGGETQTAHADWSNAEDIKNALGVSGAKAQDYWDAVNGGDNGGFTRGWDTQIRDYETMNRDDFLDKHRYEVDSLYGGDKDAYLRAVGKKARDCESLIDDSPKWNGGELTRGFKHMDDNTLAQLTTVGAKVDLNHGTASWSTNENVAKSFANYYGYGAPSGSFVAHVEGGARRGTSIRGISQFHSEDEVLGSKNEAFICTRVETRPNGEVHAYYDVVDTNYNWKKRKNICPITLKYTK